MSTPRDNVTPILKTFTVYGVWNNDGPGQDTDELIIAAVVEGEHPAIDDGEGSGWTRFCDIVHAPDWQTAESMAGLKEGRGYYSYGTDEDDE